MPRFLFSLGTVAAVLLSLQSAGSAFADTTDRCDALFNQTNWMGLAFVAEADAKAAWEEMGACLAADEIYRHRADTYAVLTVKFLNDKDQGAAGLRLLAHVMRSLSANAELGHASSQHNLATIFNARPGSYESRFIEQDEAQFARWTKRAAAQREPRALMNMAFRLAADQDVVGFARDPELAYLLVLEWQRITETRDEDRLVGLRTIVARFKDDLARELTTEQMARAAERRADFDFAALADRP